MTTETKLAEMERLVNELAHEINLAHDIECNARARHWINNHLTKIRNENEKKGNELGIWLLNNPNASVRNIQGVREMLNNKKGVRNIKVVEGVLVDEREKKLLHESFEKLVASNGGALRRLAESNVGDTKQVDEKRIKEIAEQLGLKVTFNADKPGVLNTTTGEKKQLNDYFPDLD